MSKWFHDQITLGNKLHKAGQMFYCRLLRDFLMLIYPVTQTILYSVPQISLNTEILIPGTLSTFNRTLVILVNTIWGKQL